MAELANKCSRAQHSRFPALQPKLSLSLITDTMQDGSKGLVNRRSAHWAGIIFSSHLLKNFPEIAENEHLTMRMAEAFGINTVMSSLIRPAVPENLSYITNASTEPHPEKNTHARYVPDHRSSR